MSDYFSERDKKNMQKLRELRDELPEFCDDFFIGIEPQTTTLTRVQYAYDLRIFFNFLISEVRSFKYIQSPVAITLDDINRVTVKNLEAYLEYLGLYEQNGKECVNGNKGKARKISSVRTLFKYLYSHEMIKENVASKLVMPKLHEKEIIRLDGGEVNKMLNVAEYGGFSDHQQKIHEKTKLRDTAIVTLLLGTGIRVSECVGLNLNDVDFEANAFTVTRKGGNRAILYFGDEVKTALSDYIETERKELVEHSKHEVIDKDALFLSLQVRRITVRAVENMVKKYAQLAVPIKKISPHKLRSTFGTNLYKATGDIYIVADVLGHRDVNTTKKHYAAIEEDRRKIASEVIRLHNADDGNE